MSTKRNVFGLRAIAILEIIAMLALLVVIDQFFGDGDMYWDVNPHPFWIVVLALAAQYGANEALLAAFASSILFLVGDWPERGIESDMFSYYYDVLINPILWFVGGLGVGVFTERHLRKLVRLDLDLTDSREREDTITESYSFVKKRKEDLETQVAGKLTSSVQAYRAAKAIETLDPKEVLTGVQELIAAVINPHKFSVYLLEDNILKSSIISGWTHGDSFRQEYDSSSPIYQAVIGSRTTLCIANNEHEMILNREGVLAGPIVDVETQKVVGMLKVEEMEFINLNLNTIETFKAMSEWIGSSLVNAEIYQRVKEDSVINPDHNLMTYNYFKRQSEYLTSLAKRVGFALSMIVVRLNNNERLSDDERMTIARQLSDSVGTVLRTIDMAFEYKNNGMEYSILLPATPRNGAIIVRDKIARDLDRNLRQFGEGNFTFIVQTIHEPA